MSAIRCQAPLLTKNGRRPARLVADSLRAEGRNPAESRRPAAGWESCCKGFQSRSAADRLKPPLTRGAVQNNQGGLRGSIFFCAIAPSCVLGAGRKSGGPNLGGAPRCGLTFGETCGGRAPCCGPSHGGPHYGRPGGLRKPLAEAACGSRLRKRAFSGEAFGPGQKVGSGGFLSFSFARLCPIL